MDKGPNQRSDLADHRLFDRPSAPLDFLGSPSIDLNYSLQSGLHELQRMLRKHVKKERRMNTKRKPRQAYTVRQLAVLEAEFQVRIFISEKTT